MIPLDTSLIDVDVQTKYVRVTIKEKIFQVVLFQEISPDASTARRSETTGHLVLTLPHLKPILTGKEGEELPKKNNQSENVKNGKNICEEEENGKRLPKEEKLEVDENNNEKIDIYNIVKEKNDSPDKTLSSVLYAGRKKTNIVKNEKCLEAEEDFVDDIDVPPLE